MIKVRINGGLGNQLFQYATAYALAKKMNVSMQVDISEAMKYRVHPLRLDKLSCSVPFSKKINIIDKILLHPRIISYSSKLLNRYYMEPNLRYCDFSSRMENNLFLIGYFQSELYFREYRTELLEEFRPKKNFSPYQENIKKKISSSNSLSIHIRRGDYISNPDASSVHGICDKAYFNRSIDYLQEKGVISEKTNFFIFSDDIKWCRDNLNFPYETIFVEGDSESPELDMWLMSYCNHHIISNSTFSWWGAWLNIYPNKCVIAPLDWFKTLHDSTDIVPESWVRL